MSTLDQLLARARQVEVRPGDAEACVADVRRLARTVPPPARPWWGIALGAGTALALAAVILFVVWPRPQQRGTDPVRVGDRVAILAEPGTVYRVAMADADHTEIEVERGAITARLWHGARGHRLVLRGAGVEAVATGTVYTLGVDDGEAWVQVAEGTVEITGESWRNEETRGEANTAATRLLAMSAPPPVVPVELDAGVPDAAPRLAVAADAAVVMPPQRAQRRDAGTAETAAPTLTDRWRRARLLRAQGEPQRALDECLEIADAGDKTWSPIALVEAVRIALDALASPERALEIADRVIADYPSHTLIGEARTLRCRALRQLGRGADCEPLQPD